MPEGHFLKYKFWTTNFEVHFLFLCTYALNVYVNAKLNSHTHTWKTHTHTHSHLQIYTLFFLPLCVSVFVFLSLSMTYLSHLPIYLSTHLSLFTCHLKYGLLLCGVVFILFLLVPVFFSLTCMSALIFFLKNKKLLFDRLLKDPMYLSLEVENCSELWKAWNFTLLAN